MKEAVEDSLYFLVSRINDIMIDDLRIMSVLSAQAKVAEFTPAQVKALSADAKAKYDELMKMGGAKQANEKMAELVSELCGKDGIVKQAADYVSRKDTEPTTYVGNGQNIRLSAGMNVVNVTDMVSNSGSDSAVWNGSTFDDDLNGSLSAQDIDTIAAHAADKDMTVGDYLEANSFDFGGQTGYIAASHFNDYNGSKALRQHRTTRG